MRQGSENPNKRSQTISSKIPQLTNHRILINTTPSLQLGLFKEIEQYLAEYLILAKIAAAVKLV